MDRNKAKNKPPKHLRVQVNNDAPPKVVDRENGVIYGLAVISVGEALGHTAWVDKTMIAQVVELGNLAENGIKSRFTHPGLSSDGLGTLLGPISNFRLSENGQAVLGDLEFIDAAYNSPEGDLANYVMDLAEQSPQFAGLSIVFDPDFDSQEAFIKENGGERFQSPDTENKNNFEHMRVAKLLATDVVDDPAANPKGLFFSSENLPKDASDLIDYVLGITDEKPALSALDIDADRGKIFFSTYLARRNLAVTPIGKEVQEMDPKENDAAAEGVAAEKLLCQADIDNAVQLGVASALKEERERISKITKFARELSQVQIGEECVSEGATVVDAMTKIVLAQGEVYKSLAEAQKAAYPEVDANEEANDVGSIAPLSESQKLGTEVKHEDVEKFQAAHPGMSYGDAMTELSKLAAGKVKK